MKLDIERLHDVIEGREIGRGCGQTTATVVLALQEADLQSEIGSGEYAIVVGHNSVGYMISLFRELAETLGVPCHPPAYQKRVIIVKGPYEVKVTFVSASELPNFARGRKLLNYFVDHYMAYQITPSAYESLERTLER